MSVIVINNFTDTNIKWMVAGASLFAFLQFIGRKLMKNGNNSSNSIVVAEREKNISAEEGRGRGRGLGLGLGGLNVSLIELIELDKKRSSSNLSNVRILSFADVEALLKMDKCIEINEIAFRNMDSAVIPDRLIIKHNSNNDDDDDDDDVNDGSCTLFKPALIPSQAMGIKIVGVHPHNAKLQPNPLPTVNATILLIDERNGNTRCIMDGSYLTGMRTAAGSGVATNLLAKRNARNLVIFGAGLQARQHIIAMLHVRPSIKSIKVHNRTYSKAKHLALEFRGGEAIESESAIRLAISQADIICCCTNSSTPLFDGKLVKKGCHINAIGSFTPSMQEIDEDLVLRSKTICDDVDKVITTAGDYVIPIKNHGKNNVAIIGSLCDLLNHRITVRDKIENDGDGDENITIFKSVGTAIQDVSSAYAVFLLAQSKNVGTMVKIVE